MISLKQLLLELKPFAIFAKTPARIINRVVDHSIKSSLLTITKSGKFVYQSITRNPPKDKSKPHKYRQYIWPREAAKKAIKTDKEKLYNTTFYSDNDDVFLQCTCPYFRYHLEVALHHHKASDIEISNGQEPVINNPDKIPYACKHLIAAMVNYKKYQMSNYNKRKERRLIKAKQQKELELKKQKELRKQARLEREKRRQEKLAQKEPQ